MDKNSHVGEPAAILYLPSISMQKYEDLIERVHRRYGNVRVEPVLDEKQPSIYLTRQKRRYIGLQAVLDLAFIESEESLREKPQKE